MSGPGTDSATWSIGRLARRFGLSRSTLLYYDRIGLLVPSGRSPAGYREYSRADLARMEKIFAYRAAGVPLASIRDLLIGGKGRATAVLEARLAAINDEIRALRGQQQVLVNLLQNRKALRASRILTKERWVRILTASGMDETDMRRWHREFESGAPEAHQDFLESLGIPAKEVARIREWSGRK